IIARAYANNMTSSTPTAPAVFSFSAQCGIPVNQTPVVNAGPDQTIAPPSAANLSGSATDDGLPNPPAALTYSWTKVSGPGTVTFGNAALAATTAGFSQSGTYVLRLTASDSQLSGADDIQITVQDAPPIAHIQLDPTYSQNENAAFATITVRRTFDT